MAHILLAEDDKSMLNFLTIALQRTGHSVVAHTNGLDALKAIEAIKNEQSTPFDLLLTDIVMPGMDGLELARNATNKYPKMKVMFITGFAAMAMEKEKEQKHSKNKNRKTPQILSKPFHLNDLVTRVDALLKTPA